MPDLYLQDDILCEESSLEQLCRELSAWEYRLVDFDTRDVAAYRGDEHLGPMAVLFYERRVKDLGDLRKRREQAVVYKDEERGMYVLRRYELAM